MYHRWFCNPVCLVRMCGTKKTTTRGHFSHQLEDKKLHFPSVISVLWNAGIVLVTAGFQSTLKCNWTLERQAETGGHSQGQSLAWHAIATSSLIDLYKADPPAAILSHWFRLLLLQNWATGQDAALRLLYYSVTSTTAMEAISPVKNQSGRGFCFLN